MPRRLRAGRESKPYVLLAKATIRNTKNTKKKTANKSPFFHKRWRTVWPRYRGPCWRKRVSATPQPQKTTRPQITTFCKSEKNKRRQREREGKIKEGDRRRGRKRGFFFLSYIIIFRQRQQFRASIRSAPPFEKQAVFLPWCVP